MKKFLIKIRWILFCVLFVSIQTPANESDIDFKRMCIFGDSLSDAGNAFALTREFSIRPFDLIPSAPYLIGGPTFSNGPTWIQQLGKSLHMHRSVLPAFFRRGLFCNYAVGGARARTVSPFDLDGQVSFYLGDFGARSAYGTLFVVFVGGNDIRDAVGAFGVDPTGVTSAQIVQDAVNSVANNILTLNGLVGATQFLILNAPNIAQAPAISLEGPQARILAGMLSGAYNNALAATLDQLSLIPGVEIIRFDTAAFLEDLVMNPPPVIENTTDSCITPGVISNAICKRPGSYVFWDGIHPTKTTHQLVAEAVESMLTAKE